MRVKNHRKGVIRFDFYCYSIARGASRGGPGGRAAAADNEIAGDIGVGRGGQSAVRRARAQRRAGGRLWPTAVRRRDGRARGLAEPPRASASLGGLWACFTHNRSVIPVGHSSEATSLNSAKLWRAPTCLGCLSAL